MQSFIKTNKQQTLFLTKSHSSNDSFNNNNNNLQILLKFNFNLIFFISIILPFIGLICVFLIGIIFDFNKLFNYEYDCGVSL